MKVKVIKFNEEAKLPFRAHYNDAGADCYSPIEVTIPAHGSVAIPLGFGLILPDGFMACNFPRSGHAKRGIVSQIPPIDSGYRGEIHAIVLNTSDEEVTIAKGERVCQLVMMPILMPEFVEELGTERGEGAFNSTGIL